MVNKRFSAQAREWMNKEVPKPREATHIPKLTQILQKDENGKPQLTVDTAIPLDETDMPELEDNSE